MTSQQTKFIEYLLLLPREERHRAKTAAAIYAGYSEKTARVQGARLFKHPKVLLALDVTVQRTTPASQPVTDSGSGGRRMLGACQLPGWAEEETEGKKQGRPTLYTAEIAEEICYRIATTAKSLKRVCDEDERFPSHRTVLRWVQENSDFCHQYRIAREEQGNFLAFEGLEIIDDSSLDIAFKDDGKGGATAFVDREVIARSRERAAYRKWLASKLAPKRYGEKLDVNHDGPVSDALAALIQKVTIQPEPLLALSETYGHILEVTPEEEL